MKKTFFKTKLKHWTRGILLSEKHTKSTSLTPSANNESIPHIPCNEAPGSQTFDQQSHLDEGSTTIGLEEGFCWRCSSIVDQIVLKDWDDRWDDLSLGEMKRRQDDCRFCNFLSVIQPHPLRVNGEADPVFFLQLARPICDADISGSCMVVGTSTEGLHSIGPEEPLIHNNRRYHGAQQELKNMLGMRNGYILSTSRKGWPRGRQLQINSIDYKILRGWLERCANEHEDDICHKTPDMPPTSIPGFQVIDCHQKRVVDLPAEAQYAALSYVWGAAESSAEYLGSVREMGSPIEMAPHVIHDAIKVSVELGFGYLWVDRYCIRNEQEKHEQIRRMDLIYSSAAVTIVAAAGINAYHGLPGVGETRRKQQPSITFSGSITLPNSISLESTPLTESFTLVSTIRNPQTAIKESKWYTRGWTYQEAVLSPRVIVFTDEQVYFECHKECRWESLLDPPMDNTKLLFHLGKSISEHLKIYTLKTFSYESDILNAILGILSVCTTRLSSDQISPIDRILRQKFNQSSGLPEKLMPCHVFGVPTYFLGVNRSIYSLCLFWTTERPGARRRGFPSWSWAGWKESPSSDQFPTLGDSKDAAISVESTDGEIIPLTEYMDLNLRGQDVPMISQFLLVQAKSFRCEIIYQRYNLEDQPHAGGLEKGWYAKFFDFSDTEARRDIVTPITLNKEPAEIGRCEKLDSQFNRLIPMGSSQHLQTFLVIQLGYKYVVLEPYTDAVECIGSMRMHKFWFCKRLPKKSEWESAHWDWPFSRDEGLGPTVKYRLG